MKEKKRIAIFRSLYLGDMLCMIPAVRAIRLAWPTSVITLIGLPWAERFSSRFNHYFDEFCPFPGWPGMPEADGDPKAIVEFFRQMQARSFDLVVQMHGNGERSNAICRLLAGKRMAGLYRREDYCPDPEYYAISTDDDHEVLKFLRIVDALHIERKGIDLEFPFYVEDEHEFEIANTRWNLTSERYICLHPGSRNPRKRWPASNFVALGNSLASRGHRIVLTGSRSERDLLSEVESGINHPVVNIVKGATCEVSLGLLGKVIKHSSLLITNDTGVSHIASALAVPSVIIFSDHSNVKRWLPLDDALHRAITAEQAKNVAHVISCALSLLAANVPA